MHFKQILWIYILFNVLNVIFSPITTGGVEVYDSTDNVPISFRSPNGVKVFE